MPEEPDGDYPALYVAAWNGRADVVRALLEAGADAAQVLVDAHPDDVGNTALHACADDYDCVRALLEADPGLALIGDRRNRTPADRATDPRCKSLLAHVERGGTVASWEREQATVSTAGLWVEALPAAPTPAIPDALAALDRRYTLVDNRSGRWIVQTPGGGLNSYVLGDDTGLRPAPTPPVRARSWVAAIAGDRALVSAHKELMVWDLANNTARSALPTKDLGDIRGLAWLDADAFAIWDGQRIRAFTLARKPKPLWAIPCEGAVAMPVPASVVAFVGGRAMLGRIDREGLVGLGIVRAPVSVAWGDVIDGSLRCFLADRSGRGAIHEVHGPTAGEGHRLTRIGPDAIGHLDVLTPIAR